MNTDEGRALLARCEETRLRALRGDGMLGILPVEEIARMVAGYEALGALGMADAWLGLARYHLDDNGRHMSPAAAAERAGAAVVLGSTEARAVLRASVVRLRAEEEDDDDPANAAAAFAAIDAARGEADVDGDAAYHAGLLAFHGYGTERSPEASVRFHEEAAARNNAEAMFELHVLHATGRGAPTDAKKALEWCVKAAERGMARACFNLGAFYATGRGVELDEAKALHWYARASDAGHGRATATLAFMTLEGSGCDPDPERAEELFARAEAQGFDVETFREQLGV